jgi:hypothetical protein
MEQKVKITIGGESFEYDPSRLTLNEAEDIEDYTGLTVQEFGVALGKGSAKALKGLMFIAKRRADPETKYADIGGWNLSDIQVDTGEDADPLDPGLGTVQLEA